MHVQPIPVAQFGIGPIGAEILRLILSKPWLRLVAAVDIDPQKIGKDAATLVGLPNPAGVPVTAELHGHPTVVCHSTGSRLTEVEAQLKELLERGCHVVSTCEELAFPLDATIRESLQKSARSHNVTLLGTGVNPGFVMDKLPLTLSAVCQQVTSIEVNRIVDASHRREPLQRKVGAGMSSEQFREEVAKGSIKHMGLRESLMMIANGLGFELDKVTDESIEPVIAKSKVVTDFVTVDAGKVAGVHQRIEGTQTGRASVALDIKMYVGAEDPRDEIIIKGTPDLKMRVEGGVHGDRATAAMVVNCIPRVVAARPGLLSMDDLGVSFR